VFCFPLVYTILLRDVTIALWIIPMPSPTYIVMNNLWFLSQLSSVFFKLLLVVFILISLFSNFFPFLMAWFDSDVRGRAFLVWRVLGGSIHASLPIWIGVRDKGGFISGFLWFRPYQMWMAVYLVFFLVQYRKDRSGGESLSMLSPKWEWNLHSASH